ncbi:MAG: LysR family transcriptional regulator [Rhodospirillales bacterium]|nr:LysR family transcriptional regulator [Rhodospirillales bacterium]
MKPSLRPGLTRTETLRVGRDRTIDFLGDALRVYGTPELGRDVEIACRNLMLEHNDPGEDSVGVRMELDHSAATPLGMEVSIAVTLATLDGRRAVFDFVARDEQEEIGRGRHTRFILDIETARRRLAAKAARVGAA